MVATAPGLSSWQVATAVLDASSSRMMSALEGSGGRLESGSGDASQFTDSTVHATVPADVTALGVLGPGEEVGGLPCRAVDAQPRQNSMSALLCTATPNDVATIFMLALPMLR